MLKVFFTKMSGAGNDFVFIDKNLNPGFNLTAEKIRKICNRRYGLGADGVIEIENAPGYDFRMSYYNADGSKGSLCANGARCSIWFAKNTSRMSGDNTKFISADNEYSGEVVDDEIVKFNLRPPSKIKFNFKVKAFGQLITANYADTGSPHVVINISDVQTKPGSRKYFSDISDFPVYEIGKEIRYSPDFAPAGTNVNFIRLIDDVISIRTYERGVEEETFACGTGSVAAAIICSLTNGLNPPVELNTYGGDKLIVNFKAENQRVKNPSITGPAKIIFSGSFDEKLFI